MRVFLSIPVFIAAIFLSVSSDSRVSGIGYNGIDTTKFPPVETRKPNSDYKPAFPGQTRINGVKTTTPYKVEKIAEKMGRSWAITPLPDGRFIVTERTGYM
ncbi:MAG: PQQ-dependent sugar dehydrogenase, partial [Chitinophagaceae bacterium]